MSRGLTYFLSFCAVVAIGGAAAAFWIGWDLTAFVLDGDRRSAPLTVLRLDRLEAGRDAADYRETFLGPAARMFEEHSGQTVARALKREVRTFVSDVQEERPIPVSPQESNGFVRDLKVLIEMGHHL